MPAAIAELFVEAWNKHQSGLLAQAATLYDQVLLADPSHADARCFLGVICQSQGRLPEAEAHLRQAIRQCPGHPSARSFLGAVQAQQGKLSDAVASFQQALHWEPDNAEIQNNLGLVLAQLGSTLAGQGKPVEAEYYLQQALRLRPDDSQTHYKLGLVYARQDRFAEAIAHFQQAVRLQPDFPDAHNDLGFALQRQARFDEAIEQWRQALRWRLNYPEAHNNLANSLQSQGKLEEAVRHYRQALHYQPDFAAVHNNLGNVLRSQGKFQEALVHWREALRWRPDYAEPHYNLAKEWHRLGRLQAALDHYELALQLKPDYPEARWNRSLLWLLLGNFQRGWPEYEWRWTQPEFTQRSFAQPRWDGSALNGRTILLYAEQGLGDTLQFMRYVQMVKERGGVVCVECQPPLVPLLAGAAGIDLLLPQGSELPAFDVQAPLLSLPGIFQTSLGTVPATVPYLRARPELVDHWRRELAPLEGFKIGICWQGSPTFRGDRQRSIPLAHFKSLAKVPGVQLISLQKGPGTGQLPALAQSAVVDLDRRLDEASGPFMDTAAIMMNLDLVVSADTAVAHLAGALGVPIWTALSLVPDWRWLLEREGSPWYPTMRLFRQTRYGQWEDVFDRMVAQLHALLSQRIT